MLGSIIGTVLNIKLKSFRCSTGAMQISEGICFLQRKTTSLKQGDDDLQTVSWKQRKDKNDVMREAIALELDRI